MLDPEPIDVITAVVTDPRSADRAAFLAQDGLVLAGALNALDATGLLPRLGDESFLAHRLAGLSDAAYGRLRVVLRALAAQGWLTATPTDRDGPAPRWTEQGAVVAAHRGHYVAVGQFLGAFADVARDGWAAAWDMAAPMLPGLLHRLGARRGTVASAPDQATLAAGHLNGALLIPALLADAADGTSARADPLRATVGLEPDQVMPILGLAGSYLPVIARLSGFLSGVGDDPAQYVDRELNARSARAVHAQYDHDTLSVVLDLFSRLPTTGQPRFVAEVGCGDGSRLRDIYHAIRDRTARGTDLEAHPVTMVGIDVDPAALLTARTLLKKHQVPAVLIEGSVGDPDSIAAGLAEHGLAMDEGLHVRAFIDHTRRYLGVGDEPVGVPGAADGAYLDEAGLPLSDAQVERDLVEHLRRWVPYVRRYGLAVAESHTVAPRVARRFTGRSQSVALDALRCLTHRYPVGHDRWLQCCRAAGLESVPYQSRRDPAGQPFVSVSFNRLLPVTECIAPHLPAGPLPEAGTALPPDDGRGLHELLFTAGDTRRPRPWAADPTGWIIAQALRTIERRIATGAPGQVIRVLDYGAGTGLCAVELLKALAERRTDRRVTEAGMSFELHLVDIRTPWFDYGERLLSGHPSTRFHDLRDPEGRFRTMVEIMGQDQVDMVLASMVFHLIQPRALTKVAADLARLIAPGGTLLWSAPDVGPTGPEAFLFHDANRAIRRSVLTPPIAPTLPGTTRAAVARIHEVHSAETEKRAGRRILPTPNHVDVLAKIFDIHFIGNVYQQNFEILPDELLDTLLVPSNAEEYFPELPDRAAREEVIRAYWARVVSRLRELPGGTATGLSLRWTFGKHSPREIAGEYPR